MEAIRFAAKHAVAAAVVISGIVVFSAASYFALLAWAVLAGEPLGGPLAFPFMVLFAVVAGAVSVGAALLPVTAVTEWICLRRRMRLPWQITIATLWRSSSPRLCERPWARWQCQARFSFYCCW
jgi:hypothetical protein